MRLLIVICLTAFLLPIGLSAQSPSSQTFVFAGYPSIGMDYAKKLSRKKWSSTFSLAASPNFYFRGYSFDFSYSDSKFRDLRVLLPVTMRWDFYPATILGKIGKGKRLIGIFLDAGYCASYSLKTTLKENFYTPQDPDTPAFVFDGDLVTGSTLTFHPTFAFGFKVGRVLFFTRFISKPYQWKDLSLDWPLPEGETSYFYSWEYQQPGAMICLGYIF